MVDFIRRVYVWLLVNKWVAIHYIADTVLFIWVYTLVFDRVSFSTGLMMIFLYGFVLYSREKVSYEEGRNSRRRNREYITK